MAFLKKASREFCPAGNDGFSFVRILNAENLPCDKKCKYYVRGRMNGVVQTTKTLEPHKSDVHHWDTDLSFPFGDTDVQVVDIIIMQSRFLHKDVQIGETGTVDLNEIVDPHIWSEKTLHMGDVTLNIELYWSPLAGRAPEMRSARSDPGHVVLGSPNGQPIDTSRSDPHPPPVEWVGTSPGQSQRDAPTEDPEEEERPAPADAAATTTEPRAVDPEPQNSEVISLERRGDVISEPTLATHAQEA
eukprot:NODE_1648_length_808_cov_4.687747_g1281_i0.p1 GENE.NODE_1648_length_808_cov_4.687747_g1281_i0~~NODE_1648_length_808_cov_4.687747_g1281_i0.p1  ORF type:complete len:259 (+),score=68.57 NODE_1648_length_808_cov_4.687747_g1281_i0:45-779(+)